MDHSSNGYLSGCSSPTPPPPPPHTHMHPNSVEGGELFDRVVDVGKFSEPVGKFLFYQMLGAVKVNLMTILSSSCEYYMCMMVVG